MLDTQEDFAAHARNQNPARLQNSKRPLLRISSKRIKDNIHSS